MSLVRWTGPILEDITPWAVNKQIEKENPEIKEEKLYELYLGQFKRTEPHAVYLEAGATVYRGGETQPYDVEFQGAPSYNGAFFGDLSVAAGYYRTPGSAQPGVTPRSVAEMKLLRPLRLFPMNYTNLDRLANELWNPETDVTSDERDLMLKIINDVKRMGVKGGLDLNVRFGTLISTLETPSLGKYDGFAFYRIFFEPEGTPEGEKTRLAFRESSNEQCYVLDAKATFLKTPYVFSDPQAGLSGFPNFWGSRFPLHPALDKDATRYLSPESWGKEEDVPDIGEWQYYQQFIVPKKEGPYAEYCDADLTNQIYIILPAGSIVYQAPSGPATIFGSNLTAKTRMRNHGDRSGTPRKLVTSRMLVFANMCQETFDAMSNLTFSWRSREEREQNEEIIFEAHKFGILSDVHAEKLARMCVREWGETTKMAGIVNLPFNQKSKGVNWFGVNVDELLSKQAFEAHLGDSAGMLEAPARPFNRLIYAEEDNASPAPPPEPTIRRSARPRKNTVLWAPY